MRRICARSPALPWSLVGLAAAEPGFLGIEDAQDDFGAGFTVCYWRDAAALRRWQAEAPARVPAELPVETVFGPTGCLWPWLKDVQEAQARRPPGFAVPMYDDLEPAPRGAGKSLRRVS